VACGRGDCPRAGPSEGEGDAGAVRRRMLAWRRGLGPAEVSARSLRIAGHVLAWPAWARAGCVLVYLATPREVQTDAIIAACAHRRLCAPAVVGRELVLRRLVAGAPLAVGALGIREPDPGAEVVAPEEVDLALVPGVAFDRAGHRLGRGGGYYDRLLPRLTGARTCGLAFREQVMAALQPAPWDVAVHYVCTEEGLLPAAAAG
jgi:5-formyltetrahydrofolate cyclo-ligase